MWKTQKSVKHDSLKALAETNPTVSTRELATGRYVDHMATYFLNWPGETFVVGIIVMTLGEKCKTN